LVVFQTDIIHNPRFQRFKKIRGVLFVLLMIYGTPAFFMGGGGSSKRASFREDLMEHPELQFYIASLILLGGLFGLIHFFSWRMKKVGRLSIDEKGIQVVEEDRERYFTFDQVVNVSIERGSTFHHDHYQTKSYSGNNWIEIEHKDQTAFRGEFKINDESHNEEFEEAIKGLYKKLGRRLEYKSI